MDGIETLGRVVILATLLLVTISWTAGAIVHFPTASTRMRGLIMLVGTFGLSVLMLHVLAGLPMFDFVDRCRPDGSGRCHNGQLFAAMAHAVAAAQWRAAVMYLGIPLALGTPLGVWIMRKNES